MQQRLAAAGAAPAARAAPRRAAAVARLAPRAQAQPQPQEPQPARRELLAGLAAAALAAAAPAAAPPPAAAALVERTIPVRSLTSGQKSAMRADFIKRAEVAMRAELSAADAPVALRLLLHDAATFDAAAGAGGVNGSVVLSEELGRPENKDLKAAAAKIGKAKAAVDAGARPGQAPLSWADALVLAVKTTREEEWRAAKIALNPVKGEGLARLASNPIPLRIGRVDAGAPDAAGRVPAPGAPPAEVAAFMGALGVKDASTLVGPFARKAPFWERPTFLLWCGAQADGAASEAAFAAALPEAFGPWKAKYDASRRGSFRTDYEVDFGENIAKLADLGATFDPDAYLFPLVFMAPATL
jgi:L-ascorbate peroxidase